MVDCDHVQATPSEASLGLELRSWICEERSFLGHVGQWDSNRDSVADAAEYADGFGRDRCTGVYKKPTVDCAGEYKDFVQGSLPGDEGHMRRVGAEVTVPPVNKLR